MIEKDNESKFRDQVRRRAEGKQKDKEGGLKEKRSLQRKWDPGDHRDKGIKQILKEEGCQGRMLQKTGKALLVGPSGGQ